MDSHGRWTSTQDFSPIKLPEGAVGGSSQKGYEEETFQSLCIMFSPSVNEEVVRMVYEESAYDCE